MKQCTYCGAELQDDARACNNCGRPVPDMPEPEKENSVKASAEETQQPQPEPEQEPQNVPDPRNPWGQPQQQGPQGQWGQPQQQIPQNPWGQPQQDPQNQWGQSPQGQWGQPQQQIPQNPWGQPQQGPQNQWGQPQQQGPWGWQQNDPSGQGYRGPYPGYGMQQNTQVRYNTFALWSLVFGFLSSFLNGLVFIPSIIAIVFAVIGLIQISKNPGAFKGRWMAIVGLIFGVAFLVVYGYVFHIVFQAVQNPETFEQLQQYLKEINAVRS